MLDSVSAILIEEMVMPVHEVIAWILVIVSATLFIAERRRNDDTRYYMILQGLLRACYRRACFCAARTNRLRESSDTSIPLAQHILFVESSYTEYTSMMEQLMGSMKSLRPGQDMPFDVQRFLSAPQVPSAVPPRPAGPGEEPAR